MQTALKLFEIPSVDQGASGDVCKIAVKMPVSDDRTSAQNTEEFMQIMATLMALPPDQLQTSLDRLDWVLLEDDIQGLAPLIDLTNPQTQTRAIMDGLSEQTDQTVKLQSLPLNEQSLTDTTVSQRKLTQAQYKILHSSIQAQQNGESIQPPEQTSKQPSNLHGLKVFTTSVDKESMLPAKTTKQMIPENSYTDIEQKQAKPSQQVLKQSVPSQQVLRQSVPSQQVIINDRLQAAPQQQQVSKKDTYSINLKTFSNNQSISGNLQQPSTESGKEVSVWTALDQKSHSSKQLGPEKAFTNADNALYIEKSGNANSIVERPALQQNLTMNALEPIVESGSKSESMAKTKTQETQEAMRLSQNTKELQTDVMRQIVQKMRLHTDGSQSRMHIKLKPEFLGNVRMQITTDHQQVVIRMTADSAAVKDIIEHNVHFLKTELQHHGLEIEKFDVFVSHDDWKNNQHAAFQQARQQSERRQSKESETPQNDSDDVASKDTSPQSRDDLNEVDFFA